MVFPFNIRQGNSIVTQIVCQEGIQVIVSMRIVLIVIWGIVWILVVEQVSQRQLHSILLSSAKAAPVITEQWFAETGSCNSVDDNGDSCSLVPNWLDTGSVDELMRTWQQEELAIRQIIIYA